MGTIGWMDRHDEEKSGFSIFFFLRTPLNVKTWKDYRGVVPDIALVTPYLICINHGYVYTKNKMMNLVCSALTDK
jgi:hypothetical protein